MRVPQVKQALSILDLLERKPVLRFGELERQMSVSKPTLSAMLQVLVESGLVNKSNDGYRLGQRILQLSAVYQKRNPLRQVAYPFLDQLHQLTNERVELSIPDGLAMLFIEVLETLDPIGLHMRVGAKANRLHAMATGKVLLAFLSDEEREQFYQSPSFCVDTPNTTTDRKLVEAELAKIRVERAAMDIEEARIGAARFAAAIMNHLGELVGVVSIPVPAFGLDEDRKKFLYEEVKNTASAISQELGFKDSISKPVT